MQAAPSWEGSALSYAQTLIVAHAMVEQHYASGRDDYPSRHVASLEPACSRCLDRLCLGVRHIAC